MKSKYEYMEDMKGALVPAGQDHWKMMVEILLDIRDLLDRQSMDYESVKSAREELLSQVSDVKKAREASGGDEDGTE